MIQNKNFFRLTDPNVLRTHVLRFVKVANPCLGFEFSFPEKGYIGFTLPQAMGMDVFTSRFMEPFLLGPCDVSFQSLQALY